MIQVHETDFSTGSVEIVPVTEDKLPDTTLCFFYKRLFSIQPAKVDPGENENGKVAYFITVEIKIISRKSSVQEFGSRRKRQLWLSS